MNHDATGPPTFAEELRDLRRLRGHSIREFATISHHSKSLISKWETGGGIPSAEVVDELEAHLGGGGRLIAAAAIPAPRPAERLASEVARRWAHQGPITDTVRQRAAAADEVDVLAVRGLGLLGLNDSVLRPSMISRSGPLRMRVLLLDPDCEAAAQRASEIGESPAAFTAGIKLTLARLEELAAAEDGLAIEVGLYARLPDV